MPKRYAKEEIVYKYEELEWDAQQRALDKWSISQYEDYYDEPERTYIGEIIECLGFEPRKFPVKLMGGGVRYDYEFYCDPERHGDFVFNGSYSYQKNWREVWKKCAYWNPNDVIERLGIRLQKMQKPYFYGLTATIGQRHQETSYRYYNRPPIDLAHVNDSEWYDGREIPQAVQDEFNEIVIALCDWAYDILHAQWEWTGSRERAEGPDGDFEQMNYYFSEDGNTVYYDVSADELEDYVEEDA
jgi:hypothetical protein